MSVIAIIQARMSSTRLPGKVLMPLAGKPMIWHIYQRALQCKEVDHVYVATSTQQTDDPLADFCMAADLNIHRGSLENVMQRFLDIHQFHQESQYLVRITGDCPLIDPTFIDSQLQALKHFDGDICWTEVPLFPIEGQGAMSWRALHHIHSQSSSPDDKEHVGSPYLAEYPKQFRIVELSLPDLLYEANYRLTVDEPKDYKTLKTIYQNLWKGKPFSLRDTLIWLRQHPEVMENKSVQHSDINNSIKEKRRTWYSLPKAGKWEFYYD